MFTTLRNAAAGGQVLPLPGALSSSGYSPGHEQVSPGALSSSGYSPGHGLQPIALGQSSPVASSIKVFPEPYPNVMGIQSEELKVVVEKPLSLEEALKQVYNLLDERNEDLSPILNFFKERIRLLNKCELVDSITLEEFSPSSNVTVSEDAFVRKYVTVAKQKFSDLGDSYEEVYGTLIQKDILYMIDDNNARLAIPKEELDDRLNILTQDQKNKVLPILQQAQDINGEESKKIWDALKSNGFLDQEGKIVLDENRQPKEITESNLNFIEENLKDHVVSTLQQLSDYFILKAFMISLTVNGAEAHHGPYAIGSIESFINREAKQCPCCRGDIEKFVSFRDYLVEIKEDINGSIKNSDNKNKLNLLVDQLIDQCDLRKNEDIDTIIKMINEGFQPPAEVSMPPEAGFRFDEWTEAAFQLARRYTQTFDEWTEAVIMPPAAPRPCNPNPVFLFEAIMNTSIAAASLYVYDDKLSEEVLAASLLLLASSLRLGCGFCTLSDCGDFLIRKALPESMIMGSIIATLCLADKSFLKPTMAIYGAIRYLVLLCLIIVTI